MSDDAGIEAALDAAVVFQMDATDRIAELESERDHLRHVVRCAATELQAGHDRGCIAAALMLALGETYDDPWTQYMDAEALLRKWLTTG